MLWYKFVLTHVLVSACVCINSVFLYFKFLNSRSFLSFTLLWSVHPEKNVVDPRRWPQTGCLCSIGLYFNPPHLLLKRMYILHKILIQCSTFSILAHVPPPAFVEYIFPNLSEANLMNLLQSWLWFNICILDQSATFLLKLCQSGFPIQHLFRPSENIPGMNFNMLTVPL